MKIKILLVCLLSIYVECQEREKEFIILLETNSEYLYAPTSIMSNFKDRSVHTYRTNSFIYDYGKKENGYYIGDDKGRWIFEEVPEMRKAFYVRNIHYPNEYLMAQMITQASGKYKDRIGKVGVFTKKSLILSMKLMFGFSKAYQIIIITYIILNISNQCMRSIMMEMRNIDEMFL